MSAEAEAANTRTVVVVPVYNEAGNVPRLIERLLEVEGSPDILFVDDNSPDGTGAVVHSNAQSGQRVFLLTRHGPRGFAHACREGFQWAEAHGYDICIEMDADFSHDPADVPRLIRTAEAEADIALGSRYAGGIRVLNWPVRRLLLSLCAGTYTRILTGLRLSDPTSGFKAIRTSVIRAIDWSQFRADGYGFIIEFHFHAIRKGFRIGEVPIVFTERRDGASKMSLKIMVESAVNVLKLGVRRLAG